MKKIFKTFVIMILALIVCIPMQTIAKASTVTNMDSKKDVVVSKPWTVSFNKVLSTTTVNTTNIKVLSQDGNYIDIKVSLGNSNKNVVVQPVKDYEYNKTYTLIVTDQVKSSDGKFLPSEVRMNFTTKSEPAKSEPTKPSEFTVCIDPGQYYSVIKGSSGIKAKDINLSIALKLGNILKARGFNVAYTRSSDAVSWTQSGEEDAKTLIAKNANADVFLSINTNDSDVNTANGIETYYTTDASKNKTLATFVQAELIKATQAKDRGIQVASSGGNFTILNKTGCPSIVTYLGFLSNPAEETLLISAQYQNNAAKAIANGLMNYAGFANTDTTYDNTLRISSIPDITGSVVVGGTYSLPGTVTAIMSNGSKQTVSVKWLKAVATSIAGVTTYYGTVNGAVTNAKAIITVKAAPVASKYKVVLDPGHGGYDSGAVGPTGVMEKTVNLAIALKVGAVLTKNDVETIYTRRSDTVSWTSNVTQNLQAICDISNNAKPDYFVSIHANSADAVSASGTETYTYVGGAAAVKLAQAIQTNIVNATGSINRGIRTANYYVIKNTDATAVLVETGFISNPTQEKLLNNAAYQTKVANAIAKGILNTLGITSITY
ncbi:N-acetylmuramoyl-L-alanine amidase [Clostridium estertheticum]|uniref:N-acetylmuramoyl-L-alanine amidase n=1 Tax=Clostridium estertheticum TaxID=238834 RepID=UPI001C0B49D9|nr:N-acetylmuramoyl-L-alanine amidase [Clostridium estertheticum]MBU3214865.1 N-acetylmuramoyl-L-alanine amidase [Clostridium estertheticum]WAG57393.1 N-acetylmuramoyl-L-alanine amidase [Clostridium estertheticum]